MNQYNVLLFIRPWSVLLDVGYPAHYVCVDFRTCLERLLGRFWWFLRPEHIQPISHRGQSLSDIYPLRPLEKTSLLHPIFKNDISFSCPNVMTSLVQIDAHYFKCVIFDALTERDCYSGLFTYLCGKGLSIKPKSLSLYILMLITNAAAISLAAMHIKICGNI